MKQVLLFLIFALCFSNFSNSQDFIRPLPFLVDSLLQYGVNEKLTPGAVAIVVENNSVLYSSGYGVSDMKGSISTDIHESLFQVGSIGKLITVIAVLQQVEKNNLNLNADVNIYLNNWSIKNTFNKPVTLHHLLTHSAGLEDRNIGMLAENNKDLTPLGKHLQENMPGLLQKPGASINYSNYGYALAGYLVEVVSGLAYREYVKKHILEPIGMNSTLFQLPDNYRELEAYSKGYKTRKNGFNEVKLYPRNIVPAGSMVTTASDMGIFLKELLHNRRLLSEESYNLMFTSQFTPHPLLPGYTYGFEEQLFNGNRILAKGGKVPGFLAGLLLFPENNTGLFLATNTETDNLFVKIIDAIEDNISANAFAVPDLKKVKDPGKFTGTYYNLRISKSTVEELFSMMQGSHNIWTNNEGQLLTTINGSVQRYQQLNDSIFINAKDRDDYLVFTNLSQGKYQNFYTGKRIAGITIPATFERLSWWETSSFINEIMPFITLILLSIIIVLIIRLVIYFYQQKYRKLKHINLMPSKYFILLLGFAALLLLDIFGFWLPLLSNFEDLLFGFPDKLALFKYIHLTMAVVAGLLVLAVFIIWKNRSGSMIGRLYFSVYTISAVVFVLVLFRWSFITMSY